MTPSPRRRKAQPRPPDESIEEGRERLLCSPAVLAAGPDVRDWLRHILTGERETGTIPPRARPPGADQ